MKRTAALLGAVILLLSACGTQQITLDIQATADELAQSNLFGGDIFAIDSDIAATMYPDLPEGTSTAAYASSGASADEVAVFEARDEDGAKAILEQVQQRFSDRRESYADYMPDEAEKLKNAVARQSGVYVIAVVCADADSANEQVDGYLK
ncbi:DUF4358 domain-containing protein [Oscillibacter sp. MSJ-2]|uniref:DUF4358 domain-containing protein n=1 Tax=Dysosmobacter acutus TaxID=2841504 RepID=A0ABS6F7L4_9FIRM|nr:DUF4358 domain-containing protein [Dysosmobacter acutus]MBU5625375.1 DUF4358 domain-containing protein [Dysosmobacter acutus]